MLGKVMGRRKTPLLWVAHVTAAALCGQTATTVVRVPATSNPYLAGMPDGTTARVGDRAPEQSPVLVELSLSDAAAVTFVASGRVNHLPGCPPECDSPAGSMIEPHRNGAEHGISDITAPINALVGVFLGDERPDLSRAPRGLTFGKASKDTAPLSPELKQIFYIGTGATRARAARRFVVPRGATRLFLGTMDGFEWNNNTGSFSVTVTVERTDVSSNMFSVDSSVYFAKFACLPNRTRCTPEREIVEGKGTGQYHIVLPAQMEWGASVPTPEGGKAVIRRASGMVCLAPDRCNGAQGNGKRAGSGFLAPGSDIGALVTKTVGGLTYFSVNDRAGKAFQKHDGYFEFDVTIQ